MGLGVLEDYRLDSVPGTSKVGENTDLSSDAGEYIRGGESRGSQSCRGSGC